MGKVSGVVSLENALEELVGEIFDESERHRTFVYPRGDDCWQVRGDCPLYEIRKHYSRFEQDEPPFKSMAALFAEKSEGRELAVGDRIEGDGYGMELVEVKERQATQLVLCKSRREHTHNDSMASHHAHWPADISLFF